MRARLKVIAIGVAAILIAGAGYLMAQAYQLKKNYTLVKAEIMSVVTECFIEAGRERVVRNGTDELAYMDCRLAPLVAKQRGFRAGSVQKRNKVTYVYRSPADGRFYSGEYTRAGDLVGIEKGRKIQVHAHKTDPMETREVTTYLFFRDIGA
ncbi:hypothetical protein [Roseibium sp. Sym1]|uniref:hypothetical protein n=1 Tax=Roseibium sp. Sym1 TaxID=3016006 RepID=UPI0022B4F65A|nr:hypothetical protein [Roseibium sp. Sym1]